MNLRQAASAAEAAEAAASGEAAEKLHAETVAACGGGHHSATGTSVNWAAEMYWAAAQAAKWAAVAEYAAAPPPNRTGTAVVNRAGTKRERLAGRGPLGRTAGHGAGRPG